jgi:hypothetical protein
VFIRRYLAILANNFKHVASLTQLLTQFLTQLLTQFSAGFWITGAQFYRSFPFLFCQSGAASYFNVRRFNHHFWIRPHFCDGRLLRTPRTWQEVSVPFPPNSFGLSAWPSRRSVSVSRCRRSSGPASSWAPPFSMACKFSARSESSSSSVFHWESCYVRVGTGAEAVVESRVTRLCEFRPLGDCLLWAVFWKLQM